MPGLQLPYQPMRAVLYSPDELLSGFDPHRPESFADTRDFQIYSHFVREGGAEPANYFMGMMQSLHDHAVTNALRDLLHGRRCVAIMGGHKLPRDHSMYQKIAALSRGFTRHGFLVASGGGPGAMEASHLGAALANAPDEALAAALARLAGEASLPEEVKDIVSRQGAVDLSFVAKAHAWYRPAIEVWRGIASPGTSLAVPTWHYGHEPTSPFATHVAKYFQNSIREDGLLAIATQGIVYAPGRAGTIQEIFQDAAQNYYRTFKHFSPMVLLGVKEWTETYPVDAVLRSLFAAEDYERYVLVTDSINEARAFIEVFAP